MCKKKQQQQPAVAAMLRLTRTFVFVCVRVLVHLCMHFILLRCDIILKAFG